MSGKITNNELDTFVNGILAELQLFQAEILKERVTPLLGKTMMIARELKDPLGGFRSSHTLQATVVGAVWVADEINLVVTYIHPFTGKTMETRERP